VLSALMRQVEQGTTALMGVMLESNIFAGNQKPSRDRSKLKYGVSVTDPCIDWETTERSLTDAARVLEERRAVLPSSVHRATG
jgi:3-deoxy-7-phosphoheptulonate synthase